MLAYLSLYLYLPFVATSFLTLLMMPSVPLDKCAKCLD